MKVIILLFLKVLQLISKCLPNLSANIENRALNMVDCWGVIISVDGVHYFLRDYESFTIIGSSFERWIWRHLKPRDGETFVDVGAHIGKYALRVAKMVGEKGRVIAVEADPENFEALRKSIRINDLKNVRALNLAAWNKAQKLRLYRAVGSGRASVKGNKWRSYVEVDAMPLDDLLWEAKVDWIKMDVEGAELETLEGLKYTIENHHPKVVAEISKCNTNKAISFMRKKGYTAEIIYCGTTGNHVLFSAAKTWDSAENAKEQSTN